MPELVDLLVVGVESGMGLAGAIRAAATRTRGPLGDELKLMLREQSLGASTTESLQHLLERILATPSRFGDLSFHRKLSDGFSTLKRPYKGHSYAIPQPLGITPSRDGLDYLP